MSRFIRFEDEGHEHEGRPVYGVVNKRAGTTIGQVFWYGPWKRYTARFREDSVWSPDCLEAVAAFCEQKSASGAGRSTAPKT